MSPTPTPTDRHRHLVEARLRAALAGRYEIESELGRGGMATVYRARDVRHERLVAVKVLPPELATTVAAERFLFEIRTAAQLLHPHILGLIESGDADGVLYYVMPHVEGESLREKLHREGSLPVAEATRITHEVASALAHAHAHGIVHRDIKPENILLVEGTHVMVADFGLARAILRSSEGQLTVSRHVVGTVHYMSPEQAGNGREVDERSDIYSLGCVLFEMLAGIPPFDAAYEPAVLARHMREAPPRLRDHRRDAPAAVERLVDRALEKDPSRRQQSAEVLSRELDAAVSGARQRWYEAFGRGGDAGRRGLSAGLMAFALVALLAGIGSVAAMSPWGTPIRERVAAWWAPPLDSSRYVIVPFRRAGRSPPDLVPELLLHDAVARWNGLSVVTHFQVVDAVARQDAAHLGVGQARAIAESFGAGRFVWGDVSRVGDSLRIQASLYRSRDGASLEQATVKVPLDAAAAEEPFRRLADALLFRGASPGHREESSAGTSSFAARSTFLRAQLALQEWDLARADSDLTRAISLDPDYAAAQFWLAQLRSWSSDDPGEWRAAASSALALRSQLDERERMLSEALLHMANAQYPQACALYASLRARDPQDFAAAFGLGECLRRDDIVLPDRRSPSGWRFRASRFRAMNAYRAALELLPSIHKAFGARAFERLRGILLTTAATRVTGRRLPPDTMQFWAAPAWAGDTLVLIPFPRQDDLTPRARALSATTVQAVDHQRALFRDVAASWRRAFPDEVAPREAMAVALELQGNPTALDTLREARHLASSDEQRFGLAWEEVWLRTKFGVPDNLDGLDSARALADSLLRAAPSAPAAFAERLASLAVLTGKPHLAASLARRAEEQSTQASLAPLRTSASARGLLAYAALGAPVDSLRVMEARIGSEIRSMVPADRQPAAFSALLGQSAGLSFPVYRFASLVTLAGHNNPLIDAQAAFARGDTATARRLLEERRRGRATLRPADLTLDITYPAAWTLLALGDRAGAVDWLDPVLNAAPLYPPQSLSRLANAGALMRAMMLRAELARATGDAAAARRWARPVSILWRDADPVLRASVLRMQGIAARRPTHTDASN